MINLEQIQQDVFGLLMSAPQLATVNIVLEKKFIVQSQIEMDSIWTVQRNGKSGCGILIEVPQIESAGNNMSGPPQNVILTLVSFQNGDAAFTDELGSGLFAEEVEQFVLDALHLQCFGALGTIQADGKLSEPAREYEGINARRLTLKVKPIASRQTPRTAAIQMDTGDLTAVTLSCATPGSVIYYTLDGSFPSNPEIAKVILDNSTVGPIPAINPQATLYTGPFAAQSGQVLRAAAYADGFNPGEIRSVTI